MGLTDRSAQQHFLSRTGREICHAIANGEERPHIPKAADFKPLIGAPADEPSIAWFAHVAGEEFGMFDGGQPLTERSQRVIQELHFFCTQVVGAVERPLQQFRTGRAAAAVGTPAPPSGSSLTYVRITAGFEVADRQDVTVTTPAPRRSSVPKPRRGASPEKLSSPIAAAEAVQFNVPSAGLKAAVGIRPALGAGFEGIDT